MKRKFRVRKAGHSLGEGVSRVSSWIFYLGVWISIPRSGSKALYGTREGCLSFNWDQTPNLMSKDVSGSHITTFSH